MAAIEFVDLTAQRERLGGAVEEAIGRVLRHGRFIMGPEVAELEAELARVSRAAHAVSCSSGTDALVLALLALGVRAGDGVLVPSFTFAATAEAVALLHGVPVFVDVDADTFLLDRGSVEGGLEAAHASGTRAVGIIGVDLFGLPADYEMLDEVARRSGLWVVADAAQSFGAVASDGTPVGGLADVTTTSFFPAKPLGCYGDGGAVMTDDAELAAVMRSLRVHGQGRNKYENVRVGINGRLDTLQAAVLLEKLRIFDEELAQRQAVAARYGALLEAHVPAVLAPTQPGPARSTWAQYTIRIPGGRRDAVQEQLRAAGIPTAVYYETPLHLQPAYASAVVPNEGLPRSERLAAEVLSLPMHPYLDAGTQERIVASLAAALASA